MILNTNTDFYSDIMEIVKLFFPMNFEEIDLQIDIIKSYKDNILTFDNFVKFNQNELKLTLNYEQNNFFNEKKLTKISCYELLSKFTDKKMPWGALTGIRPSKLLRELVEIHKMDLDYALKFLNEKYFVSKSKCRLLKKLYHNQKNLISKNENEIDLYINIPFCVSRCSYCSFLSALIDKCKNMVEPYIEALEKEIIKTKELIKEKKYTVRAIYIGGGTPTSFNENQLERILKLLDYKVKEFTVESGRPDTITKEKLDIFKKYNVTRICVNPQTFNDKVLCLIGRNHTVEDIERVYKMARNYPFKINMDFIAGLPKDTIVSFKKSIKKAVDLSPDSITVHTLCLKRASTFSNEQINIFKNDTRVCKMVDFARNYLIKNEYSPYYMYRQKNMLSGLENTSFAKNFNFSIFNIDSMEETTTIIACGANGISKRIFKKENRIERHANLKDIKEYTNRIDEMIEKKYKLFN